MSAGFHPYSPLIDDAWKRSTAFMPSAFEEMAENLFNIHYARAKSSILNILNIYNILFLVLFTFLLFVFLLFLLLSPPVHAVSWYASVGSWEINRDSLTMNFTYEDYCSGNITGIQATPGGTMVDGIHSRYVNIDLNSVGVKQRRSALEGEIKSEEYTNISASADEPIVREIIKRSGSPYFEFNFTEVWPVHFQSERALVYHGTMINDLDLSRNNLDWAATKFSRSPELSSIRRYSMDLERTNISLLADEDDVLQVQFLPTKQLNYSIQAFCSGQTELSYARTASDMITILSRGEETFFGDYSLVAAINMSATNKNATRMA